MTTARLAELVQSIDLTLYDENLNPPGWDELKALLAPRAAGEACGDSGHRGPIVGVVGNTSFCATCAPAAHDHEQCIAGMERDFSDSLDQCLDRAEQAERQVQTLHAMLTQIHGGLGLAPDVGLTAAMVVARVRETREQAIEECAAIADGRYGDAMERAAVYADDDAAVMLMMAHSCAEQAQEIAGRIRALLAPAPPTDQEVG